MKPSSRNAVHTTFFSYGQKNSQAVDIWNTPWKPLTTARFSNRLLNEYCAGSPPDLRKATLPGRAFFASERRWELPPLPWIKTIWQRRQPANRILIAGCGTGSEAFALRNRFPDAEIVAI